MTLLIFACTQAVSWKCGLLNNESVLRLRKAQERVVARMKEGWELGWSSTMDGRVWLQKNGLGRGGETEGVSVATAFALAKAGVIVCDKREFPTSKYRLAENAKSHEERALQEP